MRLSHHIFAILLAVIASLAVVSAGVLPANERPEIESTIAPRGWVKIGQKCHHSYQCDSTKHFCNHGKCDHKAHVNSGCYKDIGCQSGKCSGGRCISKASRPSGTQCSKDSQCASSLCHRNKCREKKPLGGSCHHDIACLSGKCSNGACTKPGKGLRNDGSFCLTSAVCRSGNCNHFFCARKKADGEACYKDVSTFSAYNSMVKTDFLSIHSDWVPIRTL